MFLVTRPLNEADFYQNIIDIGALTNDYIEKSKKYLAAVQSKLRSEGIPVKTEPIEGDSPASIIAENTQQNGIDLIVMAIHGYTG